MRQKKNCNGNWSKASLENKTAGLWENSSLRGFFCSWRMLPWPGAAAPSLGKEGCSAPNPGSGAAPRLCLCALSAVLLLQDLQWVPAVCQGGTHRWALPKTPQQHSWTPRGKHLQLTPGLFSIFNVPILTQQPCPSSPSAGSKYRGWLSALFTRETNFNSPLHSSFISVPSLVSIFTSALPPQECVSV